MFFVSDNQDERHTFIHELLIEKTASVAIILASIDFEWTLRRAILAMGRSSTKDIRLKVLASKKGGYNGYKEAWCDEVEPRIGMRIDQAIRNWSSLHGKNGAAKIRGSIVHGASVPISVARATTHVENWLLASRDLEKLALAREGKSLFRRIVRYNAR
jgi:hypothetical protein